MLSLECESKSTERNQYMKDIIIKLFNMEPSDIEQFEVIPCGSVIQCNITLQHRPTPCPSCGKISRRVHDYYRRTLKHAVLVENDLIVVYRKSVTIVQLVKSPSLKTIHFPYLEKESRKPLLFVL